MSNRALMAIKRIDAYGLSVAFIMDPEGHVNEVVQLDTPMEAQR